MSKKIAGRNRATLKESDFIAADTVVTAGNFNYIGQVKQSAGVALRLGYGLQSGQDSAQGRIYADFQDSLAAAMDGTLRFVIMDPEDNYLSKIIELETDELRTVKTDRTKQLGFSELIPRVFQDYSIGMYFKPNVSGTLSATNTDLLMSVTKFTVR